MNNKASILLGALALVLPSGAASQRSDSGPLFRSALREDLLGCYALYTRRGHLPDSSFYNASPLVRLDSDPAFGTERDSEPGTIRVMVRLDSTGQPLGPRHPHHALGPSWLVDSTTDTLRLLFSDGFSGAAVIVVAARSSGDTLRGRIEEDWDVGPPFVTNRGNGRAVRIRCRQP